MADIKKIKTALLREFNACEPRREEVDKNEPLDDVLSMYFNAAAYMPRALTLEAITHTLRLKRRAKQATVPRVREILDRYALPPLP